MDLITIIFPILAVVGGLLALAYLNRDKNAATHKGRKRKASGDSRNKTKEELT